MSRSASDLGDVGVALDPRDVGSTHVVDVLRSCRDFLDRKRDHLETHLGDVVGDVAAHPVGHHLGLLDDLLDGQLADDAAKVAFHDEANQRFALRRRFGQELFSRRPDGIGSRLDLELRHRLDVHRDALIGVEILLRRDIEAHQLEAELLRAVNQWQDQLRAPLHDVRAAKPVANQRLVRSDLAEHPGERGEKNDHDRGGKSGDDYGGVCDGIHWTNPQLLDQETPDVPGGSAFCSANLSQRSTYAIPAWM